MESEKSNGQEVEKFRIVIEADPATNRVNIFSNIPNEIFIEGLMKVAERQLMEHYAMRRMISLREQAEKAIVVPPAGMKVQ